MLLQCDSVLHPGRIVLGGSAARTAGLAKLLPLLRAGERPPGGLLPASLSMPGGVKGAAVGALRELRGRAALAAVRRALGGRSREQLQPEQLRAVFDQFASADGALSLAALGDMLAALGARAGGEELHAAYSELGGSAASGVAWPALSAWWASQAAAGAERVTLLLSADQLRAALAEEAGSGDRLVCLEVGMTFCRPCKAFERTYKAIAECYTNVRFLRINGNENRSCTAVARDMLGVRSTPAFYFFRKGDETPVASHTGANEARLRAALDSLLAPPGAADAVDAADGTGAEAPPAPPPPPPPPVGIDTRSAQASGLSELLQLMARKRAELDRLRQQAAVAEGELAALQARLEEHTGTSKKTPL